MSEHQYDIFEIPGGACPEGFRYEQDIIGKDDEGELVQRIEQLPFASFTFMGLKAGAASSRLAGGMILMAVA